MLERVIVKKIKAALEAEGAKCLKTHGNPYLEAGTPDIVACYKGRTVVLEVKRDEKHSPTKLQWQRLTEWGAAGAKTGVVWSVEQALEVLRR